MITSFTNGPLNILLIIEVHSNLSRTATLNRGKWPLQRGGLQREVMRVGNCSFQKRFFWHMNPYHWERKLKKKKRNKKDQARQYRTLRTICQFVSLLLLQTTLVFFSVELISKMPSACGSSHLFRYIVLPRVES